MDKKLVYVCAVEEVEESAEVSANHDEIWLQASASSQGLDKRE